MQHLAFIAVASASSGSTLAYVFSAILYAAVQNLSMPSSSVGITPLLVVALTNTSTLYIPARISEAASERVRQAAVRVYQALGCRGLSRVDFFVTFEGEEVVFNEINTLPGFTSISMYPKLFEASGIPYSQLIDKLIQLAMEA